MRCRKCGCQSQTGAITEQDASQLQQVADTDLCGLQPPESFSIQPVKKFRSVYIPQRSKSLVLAHEQPSHVTPAQQWFERGAPAPRDSWVPQAASSLLPAKVSVVRWEEVVWKRGCGTIPLLT